MPDISKVPLRFRPLCFIDTETTGLNPHDNDIIEFYAEKDIDLRKEHAESRIPGSPQVPLWAGSTRSFLHLKIKMERPENAHPKALEVNGYTEEAWRDAVQMKDALPRILNFLSGTVIVGQNTGFDIGFLRFACSRHGLDEGILPHRAVDVITLSYEHLVPLGLNYVSLKNVCRVLGISNEGAHAADVDVARTRRAYELLNKPKWYRRLLWWWRLREKRK